MTHGTLFSIIRLKLGIPQGGGDNCNTIGENGKKSPFLLNFGSNISNASYSTLKHKTNWYKTPESNHRYYNQ